jgi:hypothetical protein
MPIEQRLTQKQKEYERNLKAKNEEKARKEMEQVTGRPE